MRQELEKGKQKYDYTKILKAVKELPFKVGRNLLADFLNGSYKNKSITKNRLDELYNFDTLHWDKEKIFREIDNLVNNGMLEWVISDYSRFVKVLSITIRGQNEIINPTMPEKELKNNIEYSESKITEEDKIKFNELDHFLNGYNENQKKAIISNSKKILSVAGAGSGKTTVLTKRIEYLVKYGGMEAEEILAITFTRKARQEMEKRLKSLDIYGVQVNTFNSFCEKILKKYEIEIYGRPMGVQSYGDKILAINMALANLGIDMENALNKYFTKNQKKFKTENQLANNFMNDCFSVMEYFKLTGEEEYDFSKNKENGDKENAKMIFQINQYLKEHMNMQGLRDYSDQLIDAVKFLKENKEKIPKFNHVLIDEYQDVNAKQIELINLLNPKNLFAVGDPRQSVFGWRGSDIKYILEFEKDHGEAEVIHLTKNYRSDKKIVEFMNQASKGMGLPDLEHHIEKESKIKILDFETEHAEREFVMQKILESSIPRDEIFVLARTNRQLAELSQLMRLANISHIVKTDEVKRPVEGKKGSITLATIHAIKGLEAKKVFVIGASEQNFPCKASDHPAIEMVRLDNYNKTEEEKRLFYVAVSRAKEILYVTYVGKKPTYFITDEMFRISRE